MKTKIMTREELEAALRRVLSDVSDGHGRASLCGGPSVQLREYDGAGAAHSDGTQTEVFRLRIRHLRLLAQQRTAGSHGAPFRCGGDAKSW